VDLAVHFAQHDAKHFLQLFVKLAHAKLQGLEINHGHFRG